MRPGQGRPLPQPYMGPNEGIPAQQGLDQTNLLQSAWVGRDNGSHEFEDTTEDNGGSGVVRKISRR